jgi:glutathione peroxidase-family protein
VFAWLKSIFGSTAKQEGSFHDLEATSASGEVIPFSRYQGQVVFVVNTASKCGFTSQYKALEELFQQHKEQGLIVLGFPSNDFMGQEPGTDEEISQFCSLNFGVTFPLFKKAPVSGQRMQPVFEFLTKNGPGRFRGKVLWNFEKFLIDSNGQLVGRWRSVTAPTSEKIRGALALALSSRAE